MDSSPIPASRLSLSVGGGEAEEAARGCDRCGKG